MNTTKPVDTLAHAMKDASLDELPKLIGEIEAMKATAYLRLAAGHAPMKFEGEPERYLTAEQVAERYHVALNWIYRHKKKMPHSQPSRKCLLFPEKQLAAWFANQRGLR